MLSQLPFLECGRTRSGAPIVEFVPEQMPRKTPIGVRIQIVAHENHPVGTDQNIGAIFEQVGGTSEGVHIN
jgi:hypothetical protein